MSHTSCWSGSTHGPPQRRRRNTMLTATRIRIIFRIQYSDIVTRYLGVLCKTGEAISMSIKRSQKRLRKHPLQLDSIQCSLVFSLCLKWMQLWTETCKKLLQWFCVQYNPPGLLLLIISVQLVDVVLRFPNIILLSPSQHLHLHDSHLLNTGKIQCFSLQEQCLFQENLI